MTPVADVFTPRKRSQVMSAIRSQGNLSTERALALAFRKNGITGWRRHLPIFQTKRRKEIGMAASGSRRRAIRPDFVFRLERLAVFVDGCFWHSCPLHSRPPKNNRRFWEEKLKSNRFRDDYCNRSLRAAGWSVIRFWEHQVAKAPSRCAEEVGRRLRGRGQRPPAKRRRLCRSSPKLKFRKNS